MNKKIDHLGIAVTDLHEKIAMYENILGLPCHHQEEIQEQKVRVGMIPLQDCTIELLESTVPDGPIAEFIRKRGEGFHHIALTVDNIEKELKSLKDKQVRLIDEEYRIGAHGAKIAFIHPKSMGGLLVELVEKKQDY